jgi:hypothetical protein
MKLPELVTWIMPHALDKVDPKRFSTPQTKGDG